MSNGNTFLIARNYAKVTFMNIRSKALFIASIWFNYHTKFSTDDC